MALIGIAQRLKLAYDTDALCFNTTMTWLILVYAVVVLAGGLIGYLKAQSQASLLSGGISGVALLLAWWFSLQNPQTGLILAACLAVALTGVFFLRFRKTNKFMPAGVMGLVSVLAAIAFLVGLLI